MSYCRFSDTSDVYVFYSVGNFLDCCGCQLPGNEDSRSFEARRFSDMIAHLEEHIAAGQMVPDGVIDNLREEAAEDGDELPPPCTCCGGTGRHIRTGGPSIEFDPCDKCGETGDAAGGAA